MNFISRSFHRVLLTFNLYSGEKKLTLALKDSKLARIILDDGRHYAQISTAGQAKILIKHIENSKSSFLLDLSKKPLRKRKNGSISALDAIGQDKQVTDPITTALYNITEETDQSRAKAAICILKENSSLFESLFQYLDPRKKMEILDKYIRIPKPLSEEDGPIVNGLAMENSGTALILSKNVQFLNLLLNNPSGILPIIVKYAEDEKFCAEFINNLRNHYDFEEKLVKDFSTLNTALSHPNIASQISLTTRLSFALMHLAANDTNIVSRLPNLISGFVSTGNNQELKKAVIKFCTLLKSDMFREELFKILSAALENTASTFIDDFIHCSRSVNTSIADILCSFSYQNEVYVCMLIKNLDILIKIGLKDFCEAKALLANETVKVIIEGSVNGLLNAHSQTILMGINELIAKHIEEHNDDDTLKQMRKFLEPYNEKLKEENCKILGISQDATLAEAKRQFKNKSLETHPDKIANDEESFKKLKAAYDILKFILPSEKENPVVKSNINSAGNIIASPQQAKQVPPPPPKMSDTKYGFFTSMATSVKSFFGFGKKPSVNKQSNLPSRSYSR